MPCAFGKFGRRGKESVAGAIKRGLAGVFEDGDDETDADDLHRDVVADTEGGTGDGDQEEGSARDAGRAACADCGNDAEEERRRKVDLNAEGIRRREGEDGNGNRGARHIDRRTERNGNGVGVRIETEATAEGEIDRDVRGRATSEEGVDAGFADGDPDERVRVSTDAAEDNQRIHDEGDEEIGRDEDAQEMDVADQRGEAAVADGLGDEAHDAERREADDPSDDARDGLRDVGQDVFRRGIRRDVEGKPHDDRPREDADVIGMKEGRDGIVDDGENQIVQDFDDAGRRIDAGGVRHLQVQCRREEEGQRHADDGGRKCPDDVQNNNRFHRRIATGSAARHRIHDEEENQNRRDAFECFDEEIAENGNDGNEARRKGRNQNPNHEPDGNLLNQRDASQTICNGIKQNHPPFLMNRKESTDE